MGVNSLLKTVTRQRRDCDLNQGPSAPESSTLTTRLPSHPIIIIIIRLLRIKEAQNSKYTHFKTKKNVQVAIEERK